ncbi:MAG: transcriptional repressor [Elusimicrobiota bacterium]
MENEKEILDNYLTEKKLRKGKQREKILKQFLKIEKHVAAEELYDHIKKKNHEIGYATVQRSLKLFANCGIAREVKLGDRKTHYEHKYAHKHHDHLVCTNCGKAIEFLNTTIENLQDKIVKKYHFLPETHRLEIYGICDKCRRD